MRNTIFLAALASLSFAVGCNGAVAATMPSSDQEAIVRHVKTSDLDLGKASDRKTLDRRIAWATMDVCPFNVAPSLGEMMHSMTCRRKVQRDTRQQVAALLVKAGSPSRETVLARADVR